MNVWARKGVKVYGMGLKGKQETSTNKGPHEHQPTKTKDQPAKGQRQHQTLKATGQARRQKHKFEPNLSLKKLRYLLFVSAALSPRPPSTVHRQFPPVGLEGLDQVSSSVDALLAVVLGVTNAPTHPLLGAEAELGCLIV